MNLELFQRPSADLVTRHGTPAEFLASEEALLDFCEDHPHHPGFLSFWESPEYFVVLGYGKHLATEVNEAECRARAIPILRRATGGGTVLQGPGCLNYTLVLPIEARPELSSISSTNIYIMQQIHTALAPIVPGQLAIQGFTDLTLDTQKFSGNAQRRKKRSILFHGSFLLDFNLDLISHVLQEPQQQPEYRRHRPHRDFLRNVPIDRPTLTGAIQQTWQVTNKCTPPNTTEVSERAEKLVAEKYSQEEWNRRF